MGRKFTIFVENIAYLKKNIVFYLSTGQAEQALHKTMPQGGLRIIHIT